MVNAPNDNVFEPPKAPLKEHREISVTHDPASIETALVKLDQFLEDPATQAREDRRPGSSLRQVTIMGLICAVVFVMWLPETTVNKVLAVIATALVVGYSVRSLAYDILFAVRRRPTTPAESLHVILSAMKEWRAGYVFTHLCPTARQTRVSTPNLPPIATPEKTFAIDNPVKLKRWLMALTPLAISFERPVLADQAGRVARVRVDITQSRTIGGGWAALLGWVPVLVIWTYPKDLGGMGMLIALGALIVCEIARYRLLRGRRTVTVTRTLLRGRNGRSYLYVADLFDSAPGE